MTKLDAEEYFAKTAKWSNETLRLKLFLTEFEFQKNAQGWRDCQRELVQETASREKYQWDLEMLRACINRPNFTQIARFLLLGELPKEEVSRD
jgi:hypothetical protein